MRNRNNGVVEHSQSNITNENTVFVVLSFEGPDRYSLAGGLGIRVTNLSCTLAQKGFNTHLFFIGAPDTKGEEIANGGKLRLHRWCQWISHYYPQGVYHGENEKLYDFNESIPWYITEHIVKPAVAQNKMVAILGEEWQTAEAMCRLSDSLYYEGLRDKVVMFWNANNTFSFQRIDWGRLAYTTIITSISRYMKHVMWECGVNPLVIPNGIPKSALSEVDPFASDGFRRSLHADLVLAKVARWDPDKRWLMAVESIALLKARGIRAVLIARGGIEPHGEEVKQAARSAGLVIKDICARGTSLRDYLEALGEGNGADFLNITFHCPPELLRIIYHASDAVLANSGHEPFGLVGLETMAAGGIAFTGCTGEDYAIHLLNSIVLETSDPKEIEAYVMYLSERPELKEKIRKAGRRTAKQYTWEEVIKNLVEKLEYQARIQNILEMPKNTDYERPDIEMTEEIMRSAPEQESQSSRSARL